MSKEQMNWQKYEEGTGAHLQRTVKHGQRILVTRQFDTRDLIGYLQLQDGVEIAPDTYFALGYTILEGRDGHPTKIRVHEVSLVDEPPFIPPQRRVVDEDMDKIRQMIREEMHLLAHIIGKQVCPTCFRSYNEHPVCMCDWTEEQRTAYEEACARYEDSVKKERADDLPVRLNAPDPGGEMADDKDDERVEAEIVTIPASAPHTLTISFVHDGVKYHGTLYEVKE